ncbi:hypothetical protein D1871_17680 [Nakamurella silvestris]|nr:hypothetical protein D1871_17680 [Nakamurella silvestris]
MKVHLWGLRAVAVGTLGLGAASATLLARLLGRGNACLSPDRCDPLPNVGAFALVVVIGSGVLFALLSLVDLLRSSRLDEEHNGIVARRGMSVLTAVTEIGLLGYLALHLIGGTAEPGQPAAILALALLALLPAVIGTGRPLLLTGASVVITAVAIALAFHLVLPAPVLFAHAALLLAFSGRALHAAPRRVDAHTPFSGV